MRRKSSKHPAPRDVDGAVPGVPFVVTPTWQAVDLIDQLVLRGLYGADRAAVVEGFIYERLREICPPPRLVEPFRPVASPAPPRKRRRR
jgi:hypothetical protein